MIRRDRMPEKIFGFGCFAQLLILIGLIWFVVWGIGAIQDKLNENETTFFEQIGRDLKGIEIGRASCRERV